MSGMVDNLMGQSDPRRDDRTQFIYLAHAIDLAANTGVAEETLHYVASRVSEALQIPVFDPKKAWSMSCLPSFPGSTRGRNSLVMTNQILATSAALLIAVIDLRTPSWGMPYEVLARAENSSRPILLVCDRAPGQWPQYLQWVLGGRAVWLDAGAQWEDLTDGKVDAALTQLGLEVIQ